ncbi:hypothetical protein [Nocardia otitidiscaviarum]|uniref:WXG100 family type VII secretion target n=1 Tax=Nocardia otitidiscaviarum TaxID=1823 RepID=A0A516NS25_9NOCA|nr:hypothetical protein [Nocardia otitidiscaviarum]MBF6179693.1 hypothetical protein [Nocardia otitidiscaviarum]MCP9620939.1 hypothetical protein [Nocardia otitidiscaviarum]QDP81710.1 hypothetical protein FOH10_26295 [Nocardia otitidiscaviarum]
MGGGADSFAVDIAALRIAAATLRDSAESLRLQARRIDEHMFGIGNDEAGRNYAEHGMSVHRGLEHLAGWLRDWATATATTASGLDTAVTEYERTDRERAEQTPR